MKSASRQVLVVGSGPAGLATASRLARSGVNVSILERESVPGGVPRHCPHPSFGLREFKRPYRGADYAERMVGRAERSGAEIRVSTTVTDLDPEARTVTTTSSAGITRWEADAIVLASGSRERPRAARRITGSRAEGVYTTGELQQFTYLLNRSIGKRAVVYGAEHVSFSALITLRHAGIEPVAIVTSQPSHQSHWSLKRFATRFGQVPFYSNHTIASIEGRDRVTGVWLYFPGWGAWPGSDQQIIDTAVLRDKHRRQIFVECDTVIVSGDWVAEGELAITSGLAADPYLGGRPSVGPDGSTKNAGVFAAGTVVRPGESAASATLGGEIVARSVTSYLIGEASPTRLAVQPNSNYLRWVWPDWIDPSDPTSLRFRVDAWLENCTLVMKQDDRTLDRIRSRRVVPGRTFETGGGAWMRRIHGTEPIRLGVEVE